MDKIQEARDYIISLTVSCAGFTERKARIILEQTTKPLYENLPKEVYSNPKTLPGIIRGDVLYVEGVGFPGTPDKDPIRDQYQKVIDAAMKAFKKIVSDAMSEYYKIEKPAKQEKNTAITLASRQYNTAVKELHKVEDWFEFRRTYQKSYRPNIAAAVQDVHQPIHPSWETETKARDELKCHFCGDSKARTEASLNRVKYRLKHPGAGFWSRLFGRDWIDACHDCMNYMIHIWGPIKHEVVDENVRVDKTYYCKNEQHQMCGGIDCKCDCHRHIMLYDTPPFVLAGSICPACQGSGRLPGVLPYLSRVCPTCNGSGKVFK